MNQDKENALKYFLHINQQESKNTSSKSFKVLFVAKFETSCWHLTPHICYIKKDGSFGREVEHIDDYLDRKDLAITGEEILAIQYLLANEKKNTAGFPYGISIGFVWQLLRKSLIFQDARHDTRLVFYPHDLNLHLDVVEYRDSYQFVFHLTGHHDFTDIVDETYKILTGDVLFLVKNNILYEIKNNLPLYFITPFLQQNFKLAIAKKEFAHYFRLLYPRLAATTKINLPASIPLITLDALSHKRLYLSEDEGRVQIQVKFAYGEPGIEVDGLTFTKIDLKTEGKTFYAILRQDKVEQLWLAMLEHHTLYRQANALYVDSSLNLLEWLTEVLPMFAEKGFEILGEEKLGRFRLRRGKPVIRSYVSEGLDWFDVKINIEIDGLMIDTAQIQRVLRSKSRFIRLSDGSFFHLDDQILQKLGFIKKIAQKSQHKDKFEISKYNFNILNELLAFSNQVKMSKQLKRLLAQLANFKGIQPVEPHPLFNGTLRPYQKNGLAWLFFLNKYHFGGCLADDMGLGKTVQALALLQKKGIKKLKPNLIIAPTSVLYNWQREIRRFTPNLNLMVFSGKDRLKSLRKLKKFDIIVTTYTLLWRERELFRNILFNYVILDESQKIKNPYALTARCARELQAQNRLVMTGTPIENNTLEMWSQFEFINPGMLGSIHSFRDNYTYPIERNGDEEKSTHLKKMIYPFLLRRTKDEVVHELPPKIEHTVYCNMVEEQAKFYTQWYDFYRDHIYKEIAAKGLNRSRFYMLEGLNKLRQISIHPKMIDKTYKGSSGKFEHLRDTIEDITGEGHKVLIYSQFVKMLHIIRDYLNTEQIAFAYLDGKTKNRAAQVDLFQKNPAIKIFLISLKAGGTGLNLTAADYVIHVDPWWNPAVEIQATDRAHRIGQDKKVFVYRLISLDTIEEKIMELQQRKKHLVDQILPEDREMIKSITLKDIEALFDLHS